MAAAAPGARRSRRAPVSRHRATARALTDQHPPTSDQFDRAVSFIERVLEQPGQVVYVHCRAGRERTGAILAAYAAEPTSAAYTPSAPAASARKSTTAG